MKKIRKIILPIIILCLLIQSVCMAQESVKFDIVLSDSCHWDKSKIKKNKVLSNIDGYIIKRFGATIITIKGIAYNPCNLPPNLVGKIINLSAVVYKKDSQTDGIPIKLTYLKVLSD